MRVANSSSLTDMLGDLGASSPTGIARQSPTFQSFAGEMAVASTPEPAAQSQSLNSSAAVAAEPKMGSLPEMVQTPSSAQPASTPQADAAPAAAKAVQAVAADSKVTDGLIALASTNEKGEPTGTAQAPQPYSSQNPVFNLVTRQESAAYARECRAAVDSALRKAGLDPAMFKMSYWEEAVSYPGGGYLNRQLTVETPQGYRMDFNAALALQHPHVTASEIRLLSNGYWNTGPTAA